LENLKGEEILDSVASLMTDWKEREVMARLGPQVVDGKGAARVCDVIIENCN
jgi:hypothetical protein